MKHLLLSLSLLLAALTAHAQRTQRQETYEVNSPSVWAKNTSISYGIKPSVLDGLADLYQKDGLDSLARHKKVEKLIRDFRAVAPKEQKKLDLSPADRQKLGLADRPDVAEVLEFQLYTQGANSPAVYALGDVKIWYGIPKKAFLGIVAVLEAKQAQVEDFGKKLAESVKNYEDLKAKLSTYGPSNPTMKKAEQLLDEGKLLEVEKLLKTDFFLRQKGLAYEGYVLGKTEQLLLKYDSAAYFYLAAVQNDPNNSQYLLAYAYNEDTRAHYDEAITYYQKALAIDTVTFRDKPEKAAVLYNNIGLIRQKKSEYNHAIALYEKSLLILVQVFGDNHPYVAVQYNNLGGAWGNKGEYDHSIIFYEKALAIDSSAFGNKHPDVATRYNNLGEAYRQKGEYDHAISLFEKALPIFIQSFGEKHPNVAVQYNNLGAGYQDKGEYDRAITFFEKAFAIDSIIFGNKHPDMAACYNHLGEVYREKGEYGHAIAFFEKALPIFIQSFGEKHPSVAVQYNNLGLAWVAKGEYDRAITLYKKALAIDTIVFGNKHSTVATCYNNLGEAYRQKGDNDNAIAFFEKALPIFTLTLGPKHPNVAGQYSNLGTAWQAKGENDSAIVFFEKALPIFILALGPKHPNVAVQYSNLGSAWQAKGENDRAIALFEKALPIFIQSVGDKHPNVAVQYNNLGEIWRQKGEYDRAIAFYEKALAIDSVAFGYKHPNIATRYNNLGLAWQAKGEYDRAIAFYEKCQSILVLFFEPKHPYPKTTAQSLAVVSNDRGMELLLEKKYTEALLYFQKALTNAEAAEDWAFSLNCLNNLGFMHKRLGQYAEGLKALEKGLARAAQLNQGIDEELKTIPAETLQKPEVQAEIAELKNLSVIRRMRYHALDCLAGLGRKKEAEQRAALLYTEALEAKDERTVEDLKKDGWVK